MSAMRRPLTVEWMLLTVVVLWSLNLVVTRYILTHGFHPLAYATVRYGARGVIFVGIALVAERSLRVRRADIGLVVLAALCLWLDQLSFVYALQKTSASTIALILGATPIFAALIGMAFGLERLSRSSARRCHLVAGSPSSPWARRRALRRLARNLLGIAAAATWPATRSRSRR